MPINALIAQGVEPIGRDLPHIAQMFEQRNQWNEAQQRQNALLDLQKDQFDWQKSRVEQSDAGHIEEQRLQRSLAQVEWALDPNVNKQMIEQAIPEIVHGFEQLHGPGSWAAADDAAVKQSAYQAQIQLSSALGKGPPESSPQTDDLKEYAVAKQQGYPGSLRDWIFEGKRAGATNVNVNANTGSKFGEAFAAKQADQYSQLYDQAQKAPELVERASRVQELLKTGAYTGAAADFKLQFGKAAKAAGLDYGGTDLDNTEALAQELAASTLDSIKASGLGGGTGFSNADRDFLERVVGGKIVLERGTIGRLSNLNQRAAKLTIKRWNDTAARLKKANPGLLEQIGVADVAEPAAGPATPRGPVRVASPDEARKLPSGTEFIGPDGQLRRVP
jgi:hypothetical protein